MSRFLDWLDSRFPFKDKCEACAHEWLHHHTGSRTKGMPHEGGAYYCWCLDAQPPEDEHLEQRK